MKPSRIIWILLLIFGALLAFNVIGIFGPANQITIDNGIGFALIILSGYKLTNGARHR